MAPVHFTLPAMKTSHRAAAGAILIASCAALSAASAAPKGRAAERGGVPRHGMVVYSDLCVNPDSGEFGGQRITLQRFAEVDTVIYEYTAGGLSWPLVASEVNVDPRGKMMYFTVQPPEGEPRTVSGKFSPKGDALILDGGYCGDETVPMKLDKVRDFGRKAGACKPCPAGWKGKAPAQGDDVPAGVPEEGVKPVSPKWEPVPPSQG